MRLTHIPILLATALVASSSPLSTASCAGKETLVTEYIGPQKDVLAEYYSCASAPTTFGNTTVTPSTTTAAKRASPTDLCGASCTTTCYTPAGGGPDPNDCQVIADALLFEGQNTGPLFTLGTAGNSTTNFIRLRYSSCNSTIVNQDPTSIEYCYSDWAGVTGYVGKNCQATSSPPAHGGICVASDQQFFIHADPPTFCLMKTHFPVALTFLFLVPCVFGHGYVSVLDVEGTSYASFNGDEPTEDGQATQPSVIRRISTIDPVKGASNPFLNCGQNATVAALVAPTQAGDALALHWEAGGGQGWPHNIGPLMFYLANCGSSPCNQFDSTTAKWFKISEVGLMSDNVTWYQANLSASHPLALHFIAQFHDVSLHAEAGGPANVTLPSNIAPGNYLLRHEIIALHLANTQGGAEFYPSCIQLNITGNGNGKPTSSELVSFPGAYKDTDPGIYVPDVRCSLLLCEK
ncbi:hypothetical protein HWV62_39760 [Athelia sp. TMB]|nr:hypothetical protein HWV62_39760 [Athelia sp. TMB]